MRLEHAVQDVYDLVSIRVDTPEGTMFVNIIEDKKNPIGIDLHIGKAGSAIRAWSQSLARVMTIALEHGVTVNEIIAELSTQRSDRSRVGRNGNKIRSGPEGIAFALINYNRDRYIETANSLHLDEENDDEIGTRNVWRRRMGT